MPFRDPEQRRRYKRAWRAAHRAQRVPTARGGASQPVQSFPSLNSFALADHVSPMKPYGTFGQFPVPREEASLFAGGPFAQAWPEREREDADAPSSVGFGSVLLWTALVCGGLYLLFRLAGFAQAKMQNVAASAREVVSGGGSAVEAARVWPAWIPKARLP
jgi:hypothetical protein